jgi:iron complex transport system substrate-binding protein
MNIVSLLPSATEIVASLGLTENLVGVTHSCDFPESVSGLPRVTSTVIPKEATSRQIDQAVKESRAQGALLYMIDLVLIGRAAGVEDRAFKLVEESRQRIERVRSRVQGLETVSVVVLEWIDPLFSAGHWTPDVVELAGGYEPIAMAGARSRQLRWDEILHANPEVLVLACCGQDIQRAMQDWGYLRGLPGFEELRAVLSGSVFVADGAAHFSRPSLRLIDSLELLAESLHPSSSSGARSLTRVSSVLEQ